MKHRLILGLAGLCLTASGCKSPQDKYMDLSNRYSAAGNTYLQDCPMLNDQGKNDVGAHPNTSPKCVEEKKQYDDLGKQVADAQRDASK